MKGDRKRRKSGFQKGNNVSDQVLKKPKMDQQCENVHTFQRLTKSEMEQVVNKPYTLHRNSIDEITGSTPLNICILRPRKDAELEVDKNLKADEKLINEADTYRLIQIKKNADMWNYTFKEHRSLNENCGGYLHWDLSKEIKVGLGWTEVMKCDRCAYTSKTFMLYQEVRTGNPGRPSANINRAIHYGLTQTPVGPTSFRKLLLASHIPAPSRSGMQKAANSVCTDIKERNIQDMKERREALKLINKLRGKPENEIDIEADGTYNNKLYSGVGNTPFQPATQCNYLIVENVTKDKQVIAMENVNKLCSKHGIHNCDSEIKDCDVKTAPCSASENITTSIGDEKQWASRCLMDLKMNNNLEVKHLTTDPDTRAFKAAENLNEQGKTSTKPVQLIDTRHLTDNHRKYMKTKATLINIMPGGNKLEKEKMCHKLALDLSKRCQAEFEKQLQMTSDYEKVKKRMSYVRHAIVSCYLGNQSVCELFSTVCNGLKDNWIHKSAYLPQDFKLNHSDNNYKLLEECVLYRLSDEIMDKTRLNSNSQKVESANRVLRRSVPVNVTYPRNFDGRSHSAVHSLNNGPGESITKLLNTGRCAVPAGTRVAGALKNEQNNTSYKRHYAKLSKCKQRRYRRRHLLFELYRKQAEMKHYSKAQLLTDGYQRRRQATKVRKSIKTDHSYCAKKK